MVKLAKTWSKFFRLSISPTPYSNWVAATNFPPSLLNPSNIGTSPAAIVLNEQINLKMEQENRANVKRGGRNDQKLPFLLFENTKILTTEDSKMLRMWSPKKYQGRIISKHGDIITKVIKIVDVKNKNNNVNLFITSSCDGAIKSH